MAVVDDKVSAALLARIKSHFAGLGVGKVEVPEWGEDGKSLFVYFSPLTLQEKQRLEQARDREGRIAALADLVVLKAMDAEGKKLFTVEHKAILLRTADTDVLSRIANAIAAGPSQEDAEKNSSGTSS